MFTVVRLNEAIFDGSSLVSRALGLLAPHVAACSKFDMVGVPDCRRFGAGFCRGTPVAIRNPNRQRVSALYRTGATNCLGVRLIYVTALSYSGRAPE